MLAKTPPSELPPDDQAVSIIFVDPQGKAFRLITADNVREATKQAAIGILELDTLEVGMRIEVKRV